MTAVDDESDILDDEVSSQGVDTGPLEISVVEVRVPLTDVDEAEEYVSVRLDVRLDVRLSP